MSITKQTVLIGNSEIDQILFFNPSIKKAASFMKRPFRESTDIIA